MKRGLHCALLLACAVAAFGQDEKASLRPPRVLEVGLNGEYVPGQPTSVRLQVTNPLPQPLSVELRLRG